MTISVTVKLLLGICLLLFFLLVIKTVISQLIKFCYETTEKHAILVEQEKKGSGGETTGENQGTRNTNLEDTEELTEQNIEELIAVADAAEEEDTR